MMSLVFDKVLLVSLLLGEDLSLLLDFIMVNDKRLVCLLSLLSQVILRRRCLVRRLETDEGVWLSSGLTMEVPHGLYLSIVGKERPKIILLDRFIEAFYIEVAPLF